MKVPAKPVDEFRSLTNQVASVIGQELDLAGRFIQPGDRQILLTQRGHRNGVSVDGVGFSRLAGAAPMHGHQLGLDTDHRVTAAQQIRFEPPSHVAAVLERELHLRPLGGPLDCRQVTLGGGLDGPLPDLTADVVDSYECVGGFVGVDSDHDQLATPIRLTGCRRRIGAFAGRPQSGTSGRLLSGHTNDPPGPVGPHIRTSHQPASRGSEIANESHRTSPG